MREKNRIIVDLDDMGSLEQIKPLVKILSPHVLCFRIGLKLITAFGRQVVDLILTNGGQVLYGGNFYDIPETVGGAAKAIAEMGIGVIMFTVHAAGKNSIEAAVANKGLSMVIGVIMTQVDERIPKLAEMFAELRTDGIICLPRALKILGREKRFSNLLKIATDIYPEWASAKNQEETMTPTEAIKAGATVLIIGRPITNPPPKIGTPVDAVKKIAKEIVLASEQKEKP